MNKILSAIKCAHCHKTLETPVLLPCSDSICKKHIDSNKLSISCEKCGENYAIPENGFPFNKGLAQIIEAEISNLDFGKVHSQAKEACKKFEDVLIEVEVLLKDPYNYTHDVISDLKNTVQLKGEELKQRIDQEMAKLFEALDQYEKECKAFLSSDEYKDKTDKINDELKIVQSNLDSWKEYLNKIKFDEEKWKSIIKESDEKLKNATFVLNCLKNELLLNKLDNIKEPVQYFKSINIDSLISFNKLLDSKILNFDLFQTLQKILASKDIVNLKWKLLYRGSRDGYINNFLNAKCINKPNTLTIIKSKSGNVFGGFLNAMWINAPVSDQNSFIFSLVNNENKTHIFNHHRVTRLFVGTTGNYLSNMPLVLQTFSPDIVICDSCNTTENSYSNLGTNYSNQEFLQNSLRAQTILAGSHHFQVSEIEIFQIQ